MKDIFGSLLFLRPRQESNPHFENRNLTCYPLHHEGNFCNRQDSLYKEYGNYAIAIFNALYLTFIDQHLYDRCTVEMGKVSTERL